MTEIRPVKLNFGEIDTVVLLGGGLVLSRLMIDLRRWGYDVKVFTSLRHLEERLPDPDGTFKDVLMSAKMPFVETDDISKESKLEELIGPRTLALSFGAPWIFKGELINQFDSHLLNVHGAPLPEHRGAGGFSWRILMNDQRGMSLIHTVDRGLDTGYVVKSESFDFPSDCRIPDEFETYQHTRDLEFLRDFFDEVKAKRTFDLVPQDDRRSTYFPRLHTPTHGAVDWNWSAEEIERFVRAFDDPYPGAFTCIGDLRVVVRDAQLMRHEGPFHPFQAGLIFRVHGEKVYIAAAEGGAVRLGRILNQEGENVISKSLVGTRLWTPSEWLERANSYRATYLPSGLKV